MIDFLLRLESWSSGRHQNRLTCIFHHTVLEQEGLNYCDELFEFFSSNNSFSLEMQKLEPKLYICF